MKRRAEDKRIIYYQNSANAEFWDQHWESFLTPKYFKIASKGILGSAEWQTLCDKYLSKDMLIVEAGCGTGKQVLALQQKGYNIEGVEWAVETVTRVKELLPDLPIRMGDVTRLNVPDGHYSGYLSFGVIEHRQEGPEPFIEEAYRVLKPGGIAIFSVPYFNKLRRLKAKLGFYEDILEGESFYQYAYTPELLDHYLQAVGFKILEHMGENNYKGLKDEIWLLQKFHQYKYLRTILVISVQKVTFLRQHVGHMLITVCQKPL